MVKRAVDILAALTALGLFLPLMVVVALLVLLTEGPPLLYREYRVGRQGRLFPMYKFRTLRPGSAGESTVAPEDDPRIRGAGLFLRHWRLDEFPQLFNVLRGHMSLVGPRPMPPAHAATLPREQLDVLLSVRPGLTDAASLHFLAEDAVLAGRADAEDVYLECFLPAKARMQVEGLRGASIGGDLRLLARTLAVLWSPRVRRESAVAMRQLLPPASRH